jgi:hypothetical protein
METAMFALITRISVRRLFNSYQEAVERADACPNHVDVAATIVGEIEAAYSALMTALPSTKADLALQTLAHLSFVRSTCSEDEAGGEAGISRRLLHNWLRLWVLQKPRVDLIGR